MAGVTVDSVIVSLEARVKQYQRDLDAATKQTEAAFARMRKASAEPISPTLGASKGADNQAAAVEKAETRKQRARKKTVDAEAQNNARISAMIDASIRKYEEQAKAAERAANSQVKSTNKALQAAQTRLMSTTSLGAVPGQGPADSVNYAMRDRIDLQNKLTAATIRGDQAAVDGLQDQINYLQLFNQYKRAGLNDTKAAQRAESALTDIVQARAEAEQRANLSGGVSAARAANGYRNLGRQIQDIGVGLVSGQSPFLVLAQQAPQVADALSDVGKKAGVAGLAIRGMQFLATPLGAVLLAAASAALIFGSRLFETEKITRNFDGATVNLANAIKLGADAAKEARDAIDEYNDSQKKAIEQTAAATAVQLKKNEADLNAAIAIREKLKAEQEAANAAAAGAGQAGVAGGIEGNIAAQNRQARANAALAQNQADIDRLQARVQNQRAQIGENIAKRALDQEFAINERYNDRLGILNQILNKEKASVAERARRIRALEAERKLELDRLKISQAAGRGNTVTLSSPVSGGRITSGVGRRNAPTSGASTNHRGVDIAVPIGTPVKAGASGVVISSGKLGGFGNAVVVDYGGGTIATYGHLSQLLVKRGQRVASGETIAKSGNTGRSTGAHLHYEVTQNGRTVDPTKPVRVGNQVAAEARDAAQEQRDAERIANERKREAERARDQADRYADRIAAADDRIATLKGEQAVTLEQQRDAQIAAAQRDADQANRDLDRLARDNEVGGDIAALRAKEAQILALRVAAIQKGYDREKADRDFQRAETGLISEQRNAELARDEARTRQERLRIDLELLDIADRLRIAELDRILATEDVTSELFRRALDERQYIEDSAGRRRGAVYQQNASPLDRYRKDIADVGVDINEGLEQIQVDGLKTLNDGLVDAITNATSLGDVFSRVADQIIADLIRIAIQQAIIGPLLGGGGGFGGLVSGIGNFFGGFFANGGNPPVGKVSVVGERGPELFVPKTAGTIIPNNRLNAAGGGGTIVQQTFVLDNRGGVTTPQLIDYINKTAGMKATQAASATSQALYQAIPQRMSEYQRDGI